MKETGVCHGQEPLNTAAVPGHMNGTMAVSEDTRSTPFLPPPKIHKRYILFIYSWFKHIT